MTLRRIVLLSLLALSAACSSAESSAPTNAAAPSTQPAAATDRKYFLERRAGAAVAQLYADGLETLPLNQKTLTWHLYQAALAGRDIFIDQKHRDALAMPDIIEPIVAHPNGIDAAV